MRRKNALIAGLVLTAATAVLLVYAAKRVSYLFSFEHDLRPETSELSAEPAAENRFRAVTISWDTVADAHTYNLYWSERAGVTRQTGNKIAGVVPPYRFNRVENGHTYYFVVTAVTEAGESGESDEIVYRAEP